MKTFGDFNQRLIALCEEFGVRYDGGWGSFEDDDAAGIEIVVDAMERWEPRSVGRPFQPAWTEEEYAAGLSAAEQFVIDEQAARKAASEIGGWPRPQRIVVGLPDEPLVDISGLPIGAQSGIVGSFIDLPVAVAMLDQAHPKYDWGY